MFKLTRVLNRKTLCVQVLCVPLTPAHVFRDGGQIWCAAVAGVHILSRAPGHDPQQLLVIGFGASRRGVLHQALSHHASPAL